MERELTVERIHEAMAKAKRYSTWSGRPVGRPPRQIPTSFKKYYPMRKAGDITASDFARLIGVSRPTMNKYIQVHEAKLAMYYY